MFGDDVAGVINAGTPGETEQSGGLGGQIFPADLTAEQSGRGGPDLLLWPWLLLSQEVLRRLPALGSDIDILNNFFLPC